MANICFNWVNVVGKQSDLEKLKLEVIDEWELRHEDDGQATYSFESKWSPPENELKILSLTCSVLIECEYEECGCDIWGKFAYNKGELVFNIELPYLEGKYNSMDWSDFVECEAEWKIDSDDTLDDFLEQFYFCNETELSELKEMYLNK